MMSFHNPLSCTLQSIHCTITENVDNLACIVSIDVLDVRLLGTEKENSRKLERQKRSLSNHTLENEERGNNT